MMSRARRLSGPSAISAFEWAACLVVIVIACYIRWSTLTFESIWADEAFSIELASQSWLDVVRGTALDQHPPLYYFALKLWTTLGSSVFQLRYLSAAFSILEITLVVGWGRRLLGLQAGLAAGLLLAISPLHTQWAQSVRMYSLFSLLCTLSCLLLYRFISTRRGALACAVLNVLALYTHNAAIFLVGVQALLVVTFSAKYNDWTLARKWMRANLLVGLFYLPWLFVLYSQVTLNTMTWAGPLTPEALVRMLAHLTSGSAFSGQGAIVGSIWSGCLMLLILYGIWRAQPSRAQIVFLGIWFSGALLSMFLVSQVVQFFVTKLMIWLLVPLFLLLGNGFQWLPGKWSKAVVGTVTIGFLASALFVQQAKLDNQDCRGVAQLLAQQTPSTDVVLFNAGATSFCVKVYGDPDYAVLTYPENYSVLASGFRGTEVTAEFAEKLVANMQERYQGVWLVEFWPHWFDPNGYIQDRIQRSATLEQEWQFSGLRVRYFRFAATQ